ncbi:flagellar biosynthesis anti-sigma factor FlgM [Oceanobacillus zhaokaii]|jgi:negative regulator of flagellin synthesis FlgM|uniref:Negative regulator of flagellin synthesis n=1 Tax=Oceanobacillus zhaokaii TaxID=2052660 RepID=A0A345PJ41_9BACI|nr:flagellar biosynthesis anti-sigma factor FlgM [Oceanobacillus zhaokaii]AXI10021.1 flagellar biosynthesis anti-sigma factor FlgM [Oceanobacillus zhaokaii]
MKINGPNQPNFNPYKNIIQKQAEIKKTTSKQDQVEISSYAKQLQENEKPNAKRTAYVQEIKDAIAAGDYKVDAEKVADKMVKYWSK